MATTRKDPHLQEPPARWSWGRKRFWRPSSWIRALIGLLPLLVMLPHAAGVVQYPLVTRLEQWTYDATMLRVRPPAVLDERIVIVDIDEVSLERYGRWPWPRSLLAELNDELLRRQQVAVLGFDVLFAEPERDDTMERVRSWLLAQQLPGSLSEQHLAELSWALNRDQLLAKSMRDKPVALGYYFSARAPVLETGRLPVPLQVERHHGDPLEYKQIPVMYGYTGNLPSLVEAAPQGGFINAMTDSDGVLRGIPLVVRRVMDGQSTYYPALSLRMLMMALGVDHARLVAIPDDTAEQPRLAGVMLEQGGRRLMIPTSVTGEFLVPFRKRSGVPNERFTYVSAYDLLEGNLAARALQGKLVLVGTSAPGLRDLRLTPVSTAFPGVEVHAAAVAGMLDGDMLHTPDYSRAYSVLTMLLATGVLLWVMAYGSMVGGLLWSAALAALFIGIHLHLAARHGLMLPLVATLTTILFAYVLQMSFGFFMERRTKRQLVKLFGRYVPSELVARMATHPLEYTGTEAVSRELTVMFCDLQGFTSLSEAMDPTQLQALLNDVFNRMAKVIGPNFGTIDKYMGDCVMVFWGAPLADDEHAWHAVKTALELRCMLEEFNAERALAGAPPIHISIGINTGLMSVGDMGSEMRRSYTVIGDAVNLAARLEPLSRTYGAGAVVGEHTVQQVSQVHWQWLDHIRVRGKAEAVNIYAPFTEDARLDAAQQRELGLWHKFREAYGAQHWKRCDTLLRELQSMEPASTLYGLYRERIDGFLVRPPAPEWDGAAIQGLQKSLDVTYVTNGGESLPGSGSAC